MTVLEKNFYFRLRARHEWLAITATRNDEQWSRHFLVLCRLHENGGELS